MTRLRSYIDQLLAVVLEQSPGLLEGMPRRQQGKGKSFDLLRGSSIAEVPYLATTRKIFSTCVSVLVASGATREGA